MSISKADKVLENGRVTTRKERAVEDFKMVLVGTAGFFILFLVWWLR